MLAQSGERQRSGKRRLREGKRTAANRRSALRKCRNAVSAGVLSPISSAVGRNGAVGDKESARAGARNYPSRRQIMRLRRCAATPHPSRLRRATCLPAGRSVRGSDTPPACHSTPRTPQGEGLRAYHSTARSHQGEGLAPAGGCSKKVHGFSAKLKGRIKESEYAIKQKER